MLRMPQPTISRSGRLLPASTPKSGTSPSGVPKGARMEPGGYADTRAVRTKCWGLNPMYATSGGISAAFTTVDGALIVVPTSAATGERGLHFGGIGVESRLLS
eukprot:1276180-Rhodomonas_salina.3